MENKNLSLLIENVIQMKNKPEMVFKEVSVRNFIENILDLHIESIKVCNSDYFFGDALEIVASNKLSKFKMVAGEYNDIYMSRAKEYAILVQDIMTKDEKQKYKISSILNFNDNQDRINRFKASYINKEVKDFNKEKTSKMKLLEIIIDKYPQFKYVENKMVAFYENINIDLESSSNSIFINLNKNYNLLRESELTYYIHTYTKENLTENIDKVFNAIEFYLNIVDEQKITIHNENIMPSIIKLNELLIYTNVMFDTKNMLEQNGIILKDFNIGEYEDFNTIDMYISLKDNKWVLHMSYMFNNYQELEFDTFESLVNQIEEINKLIL